MVPNNTLASKESDPQTIDCFMHHVSTRKQNQLLEFVIQVGEKETKSVSCCATNKPEVKEYGEKAAITIRVKR